MWHASFQPTFLATDIFMRAQALKALEGVGNDDLGTWEERGEGAYHVRRRLSTEEQVSIGDACDLRGSDESQERLSRAWRWLPPQLRTFAADEIQGTQ